MSAIASITIDDGQATPVSHTFNPIMSSPATYRENGNASVPLVGQSDIQLSLVDGKNGPVNRAKLTLRIPVLETTTGSSYAGYEAPPKIAYYMQANLTVLLPNRSTGSQRKDLRVLLKNLLSDAQVVSLIDNLEKPY